MLRSAFKKILDGRDLTKKEIYTFVESYSWQELGFYANKIREHYFGKKITMCTIINAKSGCCDMDCSFCSQNINSKASIKKYSLVEKSSIEGAFSYAKSSHAARCGIVTCGGRLTEHDIKTVGSYILDSKDKKNIGICASFGRLEIKNLQYLKECGVTRIHHNLETSKQFYKTICSTQLWEDRLETVKEALAEGFKVCSGGLFGLGESWEDRINLALTLKSIGIDNVPLNFFIPHKGTKLENQELLTPFEALKIISIFRFLMPKATLRICGGRNYILKDHQYDIFKAGANGMMSGNYLTAKGVDPKEDIAILEKMGFEVACYE